MLSLSVESSSSPKEGISKFWKLKWGKGPACTLTTHVVVNVISAHGSRRGDSHDQENTVTRKLIITAGRCARTSRADMGGFRPSRVEASAASIYRRSTPAHLTSGRPAPRLSRHQRLQARHSAA